MDSAPPPDHPNVIAFPPLIFASFATGSGLLHYFFRIAVLDSRTRFAIGGTLALAAVTQAIWASRVMHAEGTNVNPGKPALKIVRRGPYRYTRNPMYLSLCVLHLALGFLFNSWIMLLAALPLAAVLNFGVIVREERYLAAKFGEEYLAYLRTVRRWI